jgi:1,6-anhydro-N-acetylmuramate kinase
MKRLKILCDKNEIEMINFDEIFENELASDAKEAILFSFLGYLYEKNIECKFLTQITGSKKSSILGKKNKIFK